MAAGRLARARGLMAALEAAVALEEEDGAVPARVLVEHLVDTRRKQKLLLTQLRVLRRLLELLRRPAPPSAPPDLGRAWQGARGRWRGLKKGYGGAVGTLEGALPPTLPALRRGRGLRARLGGALAGRQQQLESLVAKLREAVGRRDQLRQRLAERGRERERRQGALRRAEAGCRLYRNLTGVRVLPPPTPGTSELELELGPPPGPPGSFPPLRLRRGPGGELSLLGPPPPLPPPPGPGLPELRAWLGEGRPLWDEMQRLQRRFALDWEPAVGRVRVLGGPGGSSPLWTLQLEPGYPRRGRGVRLLTPPGGKNPPIAPPSSCPTLTEWLELLVGAPRAGPH